MKYIFMNKYKLGGMVDNIQVIGKIIKWKVKEYLHG